MNNILLLLIILILIIFLKKIKNERFSAPQTTNIKYIWSDTNNTSKYKEEILSENPRHLVYGIWEKISNYFFISYLITYILIKII
jgi:hypothetical protein